MSNGQYIVLLVGMGLVTYLPRWIPFFVLGGRELPRWLIEWLSLIPAAILSAILLPILVTKGEPRHLQLFQPELLVAVPTMLFALKTKSLVGTVILGMLLFWMVGKIM